MDTQVALVGAGPVGLTIAMDLAQRGIDVVVVESRREDDPADAKCNTVAARTMEIFRRLGVADAVRAGGLADDFPTDVIYCTAVAGRELTRIRLPSRTERLDAHGRSAAGFPDSHWLTPEPVVRISQLYLNPLLYRHARSFPRITLLPQTRFERYDDHGDRLTVHCAGAQADALTIGCRYLIGCDGASSVVRKQMGVELLGDAEISRTRSSLVRAPGIRELFPGRPAWMSWVLNPRITGTAIAIDGESLWLLHRNVSGRRRFEDLDLDQSIRDLLGVDAGFRWEVIHHQDWTGRRLVAARFRAGNVFIAGDAAHLWIPFAGYGMNAGIADGTNLSWMLAAVLNGHADERLLAAHERERHPITEQVSRLAMGKALEYMRRSQRRSIPRLIESGTPAGWLARHRLGNQLREINTPQFACEGLNFGYFYDDSPLIHYDGEAAPGYDMGSSVPSTVPGCRLPHFWLSETESIYDALGPYYTLLQRNGHRLPARFEQAFHHADLPLTVLDVDVDAPWFRHHYLLVRTDQHVAWRGDDCPADMEHFVARLTGIAQNGTS